MISAKTTGTQIKKLVRYVQVQVFGPKDVREAPLVQPAGIDANPVNGMQAIYGNTKAQGSHTIIGFINTDALAEVGEIRVYAVPATDTDPAYVWAKNNGHLHLNGDDDFAVLFNKLKIEFNELQNSHNDLVGKHNDLLAEYKLHVHPAPGGATGTTTSTQTPATDSAADIDNAKNSRIKTNS